MTQHDCQTCGAPTPDAYLCTNDRDDLRRLIAELPAGIRDLQTAATGQANIGAIPRRLPAALIEQDAADAEHRAIPAHLRSRYPRMALVSTAMPVALGVSQLHDQAVAGLTSWVDHLAQTRGLTPPANAHLVHHDTPARITLEVIRNRMRITRVPAERRTWVNPRHVPTLAIWLLRHVDDLAQLDDAGEIHAAATNLADWIAHTTDRPAPEVFAGLCTATDVHVTHAPIIGPPCTGLTCGHETCGQIRSGIHRLVPEVVTCGAELIAAEGDTKVTCERCGTVHDIDEQRALVADSIADRIGTTREVAGFLRALTLDVDGETVQLEVTVDRIDGWLRRRRITDHGRDANQHRLVKVGEVRAYAEGIARRRAVRRVRIAS